MKSLIFKLFWKKSNFSAKKVWNQTFSTFSWKKVKSLKSLINQTFLSQNQTFRPKKFENQTFSKIKLFWPKSLIFKLLKNLIAKKSLILFKKFKGPHAPSIFALFADNELTVFNGNAKLHKSPNLERGSVRQNRHWCVLQKKGKPAKYLSFKLRTKSYILVCLGEYEWYAMLLSLL